MPLGRLAPRGRGEDERDNERDNREHMVAAEKESIRESDTQRAADQPTEHGDIVSPFCSVKCRDILALDNPRVKADSRARAAKFWNVRRFVAARSGFVKGAVLLARTDVETLEEAIGNDLRDGRVSPQWLLSDRLHYQRSLDQAKVAEILEAMRQDPNSEKSRADMVVAIRPDRCHYLINGQHHVEVAMRLGIALVEIRWFLSPGYRYERVMYGRFQKWQDSVR